MLLLATPLIGLVVFTLASWTCCHAGHIGLHQSPAANAHDVTNSRPITKSLSTGSHHKLTSQVDPQSLVKNKVNKDPYTFPEASTRLDDVTETGAQLDDVMEASTQPNDVTGDSSWINGTEVTTLGNDVIETSTQVGITKPNIWLDDVMEASTRLNDVTEDNTRLNDVTEDNTRFDDVTESVTGFYDVTEFITRFDDVTESRTGFDDVTDESFSLNEATETSTVFDDVTEVGTLLDKVTETNTWLDFIDARPLHDDIRRHGNRIDITEANTLLDVTDISTQLGDVRETSTHLGDVREASTQLGDVRRVRFQLGDVRGTNTQLGDVREINNHLDVTEPSNFIDVSDSLGDGLEDTIRASTPLGRNNMMDDHGFLVSHPEQERLDEEDDLKIYEAVVTSMAQWELHKLQKIHKRRVRRDEEVVCYMDLGCFRDEGPFDYLDMLPSPPDEVNTRFLLYTRERPDRERVIRPQNMSSILGSHFNVSRPTKLLIHGFGSSCYSVWIREMRVAILTMMDVNIICVNWQKGAEVPNYVRAASNTRLVGRQVALLIETLNSVLNTSLDDFHLIGFSLGAHVSGHAGARLQNLSRISGLDPAGPLFESYSPSVRLDHTDARFVDVIHTNADSLLMGGLGAFEAMGHVDFYPNGGRMQKGCANLFVGGVSDILWPTEGDGRYLCNHRRGYKYYLNSLAPICKFPSFVCRDYDTFLKGDCFPCKSCGNMGYYANQAGGRGPLYLVTRDTEPFCANQYKVTVHHSGGPPADPITTYGRLDITFVAADGINETLQLTQSDDTAMEAGKATVRIVVPHPALSELQAVQLRYTSYQGWIYSGFARWAIDKISLMDSLGVMLSFCHRGTTLVSGKTLHLTLLPGDCVTREAPVIPGPNPHQFNEESENEVRQKPSLQLAVVPHVKPTYNITIHQAPYNLSQSVPKPVHTPMTGHDSMLTPHQGQVSLPIIPDVPSDHKGISYDFYNITVLKPTHPPRLVFPSKLPTKLPSIRHSVAGGIVTSPASPPGSVVRDVATSSEEPVNVIPAPDLANFPTQNNFTQWPMVPHRPGQMLGSAPMPVNAHTPGNAQASGDAHTHVHLHSTTSVPAPGSHNFTHDHPLIVNRIHITTQGSPPSLADTTSAAAALPTDISVVDATSVSGDGMNRIISTWRSNATHNTHLDGDIVENSTDNIMTSDHTVHPVSVSTSSLVSLEDLVFPPLSPLHTSESKSIQLGSIGPASPPTAVGATSAPTTVGLLPSITSTSRPHHPVATQEFGHSISVGLAGMTPVQLGRPPHLLAYHLPPPTGQVPHIQADINNQVPTVLNTNSLIDGEVPDRERARALTLGPIPINSINSQHLTSGSSRVDCAGPHCSNQNDSGQPSAPVSPTLYSSVPSQVAGPHAGETTQRMPFHQPSPQRTFPYQVDTPPQPHSSYSYKYEDSQPLGAETVFRPVETLPDKLAGPSDSHQRSPAPLEPQRRPLTPHDAQVRPPGVQTELHTAFADSPPHQPPGQSPPPETIIGHGRAPQPILSSHIQEPWQIKQSQKPQDTQMDHDLGRTQNYRYQASPGQPEVKSDVQPQYQHYPSQNQQQQHHTQHQQQHHAWQQQHQRRSQQVQPPSKQLSMTVSVGNVTRVNLEEVASRPPRPIPTPSPFYVQLLPPSFSHLPHLETFSLLRESRKPQDPPIRKRGGTSGRANRGRSLSVPAPGGRAAVFTPLVLQLQDQHRGRYIPLRYIHETPLLS